MTDQGAYEDDPLTPRPGTVQGLRDRVETLLMENADLAQALNTAERDAASLAEYIKSRMGIQVWDHGDAVRLVAAIAYELSEALRESENARAAGHLASHVVYQVMLRRRNMGAMKALEAYLDESGAINRPDMMTDAMRADLRNIFEGMRGVLP